MSPGEILRGGGREAAVCAERADERVEIAAAQDVMFLHSEVELVAAAAVFLFVHKDREVAVVVLDTRHVVEEGDARDIPQGFTIADGDLVAGFDGGIDDLELAKAISGTDLVHLAVDARADDLSLAGEAEVLQEVYTLLGLCVLHHHRAALYGVEHLGGVEAEGGHVAGIENAFAVHLDPECVGRVIDDPETIFVGDGLYGLGVAGLAVDVDRHDGGGTGGDGCLDAVRVDVAGRGVDVHEHGSGAVPPDGVGRGHETIG